MKTICIAVCGARSSEDDTLFFEKLLSKNPSQSCASCHQTGFAFADGKRFSIGAEGREGDRNAMPIFNMAWKKSFFWDGRADSLRKQVLMPIENEVETHETLDNVAVKLLRTENYPALFENAFGNRNITSAQIAMALEQFILTLTSIIQNSTERWNARRHWPKTKNAALNCSRRNTIRAAVNSGRIVMVGRFLQRTALRIMDSI